MGIRRVSLISSSHEASKIFVAEATAMGLKIPRILELSRKSPRDLPRQVESFLRHSNHSEQALALLVHPKEAVAIAEHLKHSAAGIINQQPLWLIGSLGLDLKRLSAWKSVFDGGIFVEPHMPELYDFREYFITALQVTCNTC